MGKLIIWRLIEIVKTAFFSEEDLLFFKLTSDFDIIVEQLNEVILFSFLADHIEPFLFLHCQHFFDIFFLPSMLKLFVSSFVVKIDFGEIVVLQSQFSF